MGAVLSALSSFGLTDDEVHALLAFLAGLLLIGNLAFAPRPGGEPGCVIDTDDAPTTAAPPTPADDAASRSSDSDSDEEAAERASPEPLPPVPTLHAVAGLWGVEPDAVERAFTKRTLDVNGEVAEIDVRVAEGPQVTAAAARSVYAAIFLHLVERINGSLDGERGRVLGVLDIFGFEIFEHNSFEQVWKRRATKPRAPSPCSPLPLPPPPAAVHQLREREAAAALQPVHLLAGGESLL